MKKRAIGVTYPKSREFYSRRVTFDHLIEDHPQRPDVGLCIILVSFDNFGSHIKSFALALEINRLDLRMPPVKLSQEVKSTPWGLYRWPLQEYARFAALESNDSEEGIYNQP